MGDNEKMLLVAAAVVVIFFPKIMEFSKKALEKLKTNKVAQKNSTEKSGWVTDLLAIQHTLEVNGETEAANLVAQAAVEVIGVPDVKEEPR